MYPSTVCPLAMAEQLNSEDEQNIRRIAEEVSNDILTVERVETLSDGGDVLIEVSAENDLEGRNVFAGYRLESFIEEGYVPTSVAAGADGGTAWFRPIGVGLDL